MGGRRHVFAGLSPVSTPVAQSHAIKPRFGDGLTHYHSEKVCRNASAHVSYQIPPPPPKPVLRWRLCFDIMPPSGSRALVGATLINEGNVYDGSSFYR
jgi:hypothetical protein